MPDKYRDIHKSYKKIKRRGTWETRYPIDPEDADGVINRAQLAEMLDVPPESLPDSGHPDMYDSLIYIKHQLADAIMGYRDWPYLLYDPEKERLNRIHGICRKKLGYLYPYMGLSFWSYPIHEVNKIGIKLEIRLCGKRFLLLKHEPEIIYTNSYE